MNMTKILTKLVTIHGAQYTITSEGKVYGKYGQPITIRPNSSGYASFTAGRKGQRINVAVHRLVAESFIPNPLNLTDVDHLDSDRMNPRMDNLEWVTHEENIRRAYERGNHEGRATGEKNTKSVLDRTVVNEMRIDYIIYGISITEISKKYSSPWSTVNNVVKGYTWKHIPMPVLTPEVEEMLIKTNPNFDPKRVRR